MRNLPASQLAQLGLVARKAKAPDPSAGVTQRWLLIPSSKDLRRVALGEITLVALTLDSVHATSSFEARRKLVPTGREHLIAESAALAIIAELSQLAKALPDVTGFPR